MTALDAGTGSPLRVLYIAHTMARGGSASSLRLLLSRFPQGAVEAHLLAPPGPARTGFEAMGVRVHTIPALATLDSIAGVPLKGRRLLVLLRALANMRHEDEIRRVLHEVKPDLVHINERGMLHAAGVVRRAGYPVVMHARSVLDRETRWFRWYSYRKYRSDVDRLIAIDQSVRHSLRELDHCDVVYNPLRDNAQGGDGAVQRSEGGGRVRVTFLSGLMRYKGIWDLLEAARLLRDRDDIVFQVAGANAHPDAFYRSPVGRVSGVLGLAADERTATARFIERERLTDRVKLLGHVDPVSDLLARTDVLVFPSHLNGPGRSVFEAGAMGIPSVVSLRDRVEDIVVDGVTGLVVEERSPASLAAAVARLADDAALRRSLGQNARARYLEQFDGDRIAGQVMGIYRDVLQARQRPA